MKFKFLCPQCLISGNKTECVFESFVDSIEVNNNYMYEYTCSNGHANSTFIVNPRYEILYDFGISAYLDGYYREAVLDFAACLERFYEHAIYLLLGEGALSDKIKPYWDKMKSQSERQLGAYIALYYNHFGEIPNLPSDSQVKFRNNVTHKGYFPTKEETERYAKVVVEYILKVSELLPTDIASNLGAITPVIVELRSQDFARNGQPVAQEIRTMIQMMKTGISFEDALNCFRENFDFFYAK